MQPLLQSIRRDIRAARERDPAARNDLEVVLCYPGFHARLIHRLAYRLHRGRLHEKRHPTLGDGVVVGAPAQLIGAVEVGEGAGIGAGSVVVTNVPPYSTVVGVPGRVVNVRFPDTRPIHRLPDPEAETVEALQQRLLELEERLARLERD